MQESECPNIGDFGPVQHLRDSFEALGQCRPARNSWLIGDVEFVAEPYHGMVFAPTCAP